MWRVAIAAFLVAHATIHVSFLAKAPAPQPGGPRWPLHLDHSWALSQLGLGTRAVRGIGTALVWLTVIGFGGSALGVILQQEWWRPAVLLAALLSTWLLVLYIQPWLVMGPVIDLAILGSVLIARWPSIELVGA
jgi:hypothetical protein